MNEALKLPLGENPALIGQMVQFLHYADGSARALMFRERVGRNICLRCLPAPRGKKFEFSRALRQVFLTWLEAKRDDSDLWLMLIPDGVNDCMPLRGSGDEEMFEQIELFLRRQLEDFGGKSRRVFVAPVRDNGPQPHFETLETFAFGRPEMIKIQLLDPKTPNLRLVKG